jgi:hypothetical protein
VKKANKCAQLKRGTNLKCHFVLESAHVVVDQPVPAVAIGELSHNYVNLAGYPKEARLVASKVKRQIKKDLYR